MDKMTIVIVALSLFLLRSCETASRYFVSNNNGEIPVRVIVKVKERNDLPFSSIPLNAGKYKNPGQNYNTNLFTERLNITPDTAQLYYWFDLPPSTTAWIQPVEAGIPAIEYVVVNKKDTVPVPGSSNAIQSKKLFRSIPGQRFVLEIY